MPTEFTFYSALLKTEKWMSKIDFIYRLKMNCDCTDEKHRRFLQLLYKLHFSQVKRSINGDVIIQ